MLYRRFGRTELDMPVISTGGMRYQDGWKDKPLDECSDESQRNMEAIIERSLAEGINHIETARGYGPSERQLGQILPNYPRESLIVQTKIGPHDDPETFRSNFEESLQRLNLDHVDLLAIHGINDQTTLRQSIRPGGCFEMCQILREEGKCRFIGFSTHGGAADILQAIEFGEPETGKGFDYVNLHWYYIMQRNWSCIEEATRRDMGVFIISPTDKGGHLHTPGDKLMKLCEPVHPIVFNDLFCLDHPEVHTLSLGSSKPSDYDLHIEAVNLYEQRAEVLETVTSKMRAAMKQAIGHEDPEYLEDLLPEHHDVPGGLNLKVMLWLRHIALGWDMASYARSRFNLMGNASHWFPGSKVMEELAKVTDAQLEQAARGCPEPGQIPRWLRETAAMLGGEETKRQSEGG